MRIVNRKEFLAMPEGVLYSKYQPCFFGELAIKGDSIGDNDFYYQDIAGAIKSNNSGEWADILFDAQESGESFDIDLDCEGRDGMFEQDELYAVWEQKDVLTLIDRLQRLVK